MKPEALALLRQWRGGAFLLHEAERFYRIQLHRHSEAFAYQYQRGIRSRRSSYADRLRTRRLPARLADAAGHSLPALRQAGLVTGVGYDAYVRRIVFPQQQSMAVACRCAPPVRSIGP